MKKETKDKIIPLPNLECVKSFINDFIVPINLVCEQMQERKRFALMAGYYKPKKRNSYYITSVLYHGKPILTERIVINIDGKSDHEKGIGNVIYRIVLALTTAGMFLAMKAVNEMEANLKNVKKS